MQANQAAIIARNEAVVRTFLSGWDRLDVDICMAQCTDDMVYLNQPLEAIRGKADVRKMIASKAGGATTPTSSRAQKLAATSSTTSTGWAAFESTARP